MDFLFSLCEFLVIILFPLLLWKTFEGVIDNKKHLFSFALFISFLLSMLLMKNTYFIYFNSYLLIFLFKDKKALFIGSTLIILFVYFNIYLLIQYVLLFLLFFIKKNKFNCFIFISIYFYTLNYYVNYYYFINYLFIIVIFFLLELYIYKIILKDNYYELESKYNKYLFSFIHEVKNPLAVVLGYLEIMKKRDFNDSSKYWMIIDKEVNESLAIIEDYLSYGRFSVNFDYIDINLLLKDVYSDFKKLESLYDLSLNFYYDEEEVIVFGDYVKLKQVLVNIIKNGIEAHGDNKLIIDIDYKIVNNNVVIDINDNGKGISDSNLIGKEYYTSKASGNGMGVFFSKKILNIHNGNIRYLSNGKKGCDVRINLPLVKNFTNITYSSV